MKIEKSFNDLPLSMIPYPDQATAERRAKATREFWLRVAKAKIKAFNLKDTPEEYLAKCRDYQKNGVA